MVRIILTLKDHLYTEKALQYPQNYGIEDNDLQSMKVLGDKEYLNSVITSESEKFVNEISVPEEMTVGMEIECIGKFADVL